MIYPFDLLEYSEFPTPAFPLLMLRLTFITENLLGIGLCSETKGCNLRHENAVRLALIVLILSYFPTMQGFWSLIKLIMTSNKVSCL